MQPTDRLHALDAVRAFALLCGVILHATLAYLPGVPPFVTSPADDPAKSTGLAVTFFVIHVFRMTTFFLIAGFFARMMLERRGVGGFVKNRLVRILVPLALGWPVTIAFMWGLWALGLSLAFHGAIPSQPTGAPAARPALPFPWTHLWFLYVLILLYAATLLARGLIVAVDRRGRLRDWIGGLFAALVRSGLIIPALAVPTAAALYLTPAWTMWFGVPTPDSSLIPQPVSALVFSMAFGAGWLLHRRIELLQVISRAGALYLVLAGVLIGLCLALAGPVPSLTPEPDGSRKLAFAMAYAGAIWSSAFALIGLAVLLLSRPSRAVRYIADASYWIYLAHLPLVYALQIAVSGLGWSAPAKFALVVGVALPVLLLSYELLVRYSFIGAVLNGRRPRAAKARPGRAAQPA